jgi:hypothetical protein
MVVGSIPISGTMISIDEAEFKILRDKARVLDYIGGQSTGMMQPLVVHWYPTCPPKTKYPVDVKPFTPPKVCTCFDIMGYLDDSEHFPNCPALKEKEDDLAT